MYRCTTELMPSPLLQYPGYHFRPQPYLRGEFLRDTDNWGVIAIVPGGAYTWDRSYRSLKCVMHYVVSECY